MVETLSTHPVTHVRAVLATFGVLLFALLLSTAAQAQPNGTIGALASGQVARGTLESVDGAPAYHTYTFEIPEGIARLTIAVEGRGEDLDLAVKHGSEIDSYGEGGFDLRDFSDEPNPTLMLENPSPGVLYIDVVHFSGGVAEYSIAVVAETPAQASSPAELWRRGIDGWSATGVATDAGGNVYVVGPIEGRECSECSSALLRKYDAAGNELWLQEFGSEGVDTVVGVATDAQGSAYVAGWSVSPFSPGPAKSFVSRHDADGSGVWIRGLEASLTDPQADGLRPAAAVASAVTTDVDGSIVVVGSTDGDMEGTGNAGSSDVFVVKYDRDGAVLWVRQPGSAGRDVAASVATDNSGGIYVAAVTYELIGDDPATSVPDDEPPDTIWLVKYDRDGQWSWVRQFAADEIDRVVGVAVGSGGDVYLVANKVEFGVSTIFIRKYRDGVDGAEEIWSREVGSGVQASGIAADDVRGTIYLAGETVLDLEGTGNAGGVDAFLAALDGDANVLWVKHFDTEHRDRASGVAVDAAGTAAFGLTYEHVDSTLLTGWSTVLIRLGR